MKIRKVCILGGTGFVGAHLANRLTASGIHCRILSRHPQRHRQLEIGGQTELIQADPFDRQQLAAGVGGCHAVINLVGILNEVRKEKDFKRVHVELAERVVEACKTAGIGRLLHMSALHADRSEGPSLYLKSKGEGEDLVHDLGAPQVAVTSFGPSVIFGPGDSFFNRFAELLGMLPGPFPLACPTARFAPVYVGDVVEAFVRSLNEKATWGKRYQLCGPDILTLKELVEYTAATIGVRKKVVGLGDGPSRLQAKILGMLPGKPFSYDNYLSLQVDSVCSEEGLAALGIEATSMTSVVPYFLADKSERRRYLVLRKQA